MSTIKVSNIQNASTPSGGIAIDSSGHVTVDGIAYPSEGSLSGRNRIINGGMGINQRFGLNNVQPAGAGVFVADRWLAPDGTNCLTQPSTNNWADGFDAHALINTAGTATFLQHVELPRTAAAMPFAGGTQWTLSAYFAGGAGSVDVAPWVVFTDGGNGAANQSTVFQPGATTVTNPGLPLVRHSWTFTVGVNPNASNTSLSVFFICTNTGGSVSMSGVQLEPGAVATPFEHRPTTIELALCQRYFQKLGGFIVSPDVPGIARATWSFKTEMRIAPAVNWAFDGNQPTSVVGPNTDSVTGVRSLKTALAPGSTADAEL